MQILNISTTVRPSDSLSTRMFPSITHVNASYTVHIPTIMLRDLVYDQNHEVDTVYNVAGLKVVLREPLIDITSQDVLQASYSMVGTTVKLRDTVITSKINDPIQSATYNMKGSSVKLHTVVVLHTQSEPMQEATYDVVGVSVKIT